MSSTGEAAKLSYEERREVAKIVIKASGGRVPVTPGIGFPDTRRTLKLAKELERYGPDAYVVLPPYYQKPSPRALYRHYKTLADGVDVPIVIYNIPSLAGYSIPLETYEMCIDVDGVVGVKDSGGDMRYFMNLLYRFGDTWSIMQGLDSLLYPSLLVGADGGYLGGFNVIGPLEVKMYRLFKEGRYDKALEIHRDITHIMTLLSEYELPLLIKIMASEITGIDLGLPREPISYPSRHKIQILSKEIGKVFSKHKIVLI